MLTGLQERSSAWDFESVTIPRIIDWLASGEGTGRMPLPLPPAAVGLPWREAAL